MWTLASRVTSCDFERKSKRSVYCRGVSRLLHALHGTHLPCRMTDICAYSYAVWFQDDDYKTTVKSLGPVIDKCVKQNNTIDIYEDYFAGTVVDHSSEVRWLSRSDDPNPVQHVSI